MRINKPIARSKVPPAMNKLGGRQTNPEYDALVSKAKDLPENKSLPVQCENRAEYLRLYQSLRNRYKKDKGFEVQARMGELTIYLSSSSDKGEEAKVVRTKKRTGRTSGRLVFDKKASRKKVAR